MANNMMTMDEAYTCPRCSGMSVDVGEMEQIFSDARSEHVTCMNCGSTWRVYYKMLDFNKKILNITDAPLESTSDIQASDDDLLEVSCEPDDEELAANHIVADDGTKPGIEETEAN